MRLLEVQQRAWANKIAKGFNTTDVDREVFLLIREIVEATEAWMRCAYTELAEELADVVIFAVALARMTGTELDDIDLTRGRYPEILPPSRDQAQRDLLIMVRDAVKTGEAWNRADQLGTVIHLNLLLTTVGRLARAHHLDLAAAVTSKLDVNDARTYGRDDSGRLVKTVPGDGAGD